MRSFFILCMVFSVVGFGYWAYQENIKTQAAIARTEALQDEIGAARSRLSILRAEWAYLNRPERLQDLAHLSYDRLGLLPLASSHFGTVEAVAFPPTENINLGVTDVMSVAEFEAQP